MRSAYKIEIVFVQELSNNLQTKNQPSFTLWLQEIIR